MTIIDALCDPRMLGGLPKFADLSTWKRWLVFLGAVYGLPFSVLRDVGISEDEALEIFRQHTGRTTYSPPAGGYPENVLIVGRQAAKSSIGSVIADFEALRAEPEGDGTETYCILIAQDQRNSLRTLFSYAAAPFDRVPALARMVPTGWRSLWKKARRSDSLTLENGVRLAVYPCTPRSVRGLRARVVVLDELAFYKSSEGYPTDSEMLRAARPCLATTGGKLVVLSSPYAMSGALFDLHRKHFGRDDSDVLVWQASAQEMNPLLPQDYLRRMEADDPDAYRSEVLGQFRAGISTFFSAEALNACVEQGARERRPVQGQAYCSFVDAASGSGQDSFTCAIAHVDGERRMVDALRCWSPPFSPSSVIAEASQLLKRYGLSHTTGDKYAANFVVEGFQQNGIEYRYSERDRSELYLETLPLVNARAVVLLDDAETLRELRGLERKRGTSGRDRVDHGPGGHDDRSNAVCGAIVQIALRCRCNDPECDSRPPWGVGASAAITEWWQRHPWLWDEEQRAEAEAKRRREVEVADAALIRLQALVVSRIERYQASDAPGMTQVEAQLQCLLKNAPVSQQQRMRAQVLAWHESITATGGLLGDVHQEEPEPQQPVPTAAELAEAEAWAERRARSAAEIAAAVARDGVWMPPSQRGGYGRLR